MMAADISKLLPEYATIRALGYRGDYLSRVVYSQGLLLAVVGFLPGLLVSLACYEFIYEKSGIPLAMTPLRAAGVLAPDRVHVPGVPRCWRCGRSSAPTPRTCSKEGADDTK